MDAKELRASHGPLALSISSTFLSNIGVLVLGLASSVMLNRALGPEGKGMFATLLTTSQLLVIVASCGVGKAITFFLAGRELERQRAFENFLTLTLVAGLAAVLLVVLLEVLLPHRAGKGNGIFLAMLTVLMMAHGFGMGALRGLKQFASCNLLNLGTALVFIGFLALALLGDGLDARVAVVCKATAVGLILVLVVGQLRRHELALRMGWDGAVLKKIFAYGLGMFFYQFFQNLNYRFDILLVSNLAGYAQAGWYSTGTGLAEMIWYLPNAVGIVLFPVAAGLDDRGSEALVARVCRWSLLLMTIGTASLTLLAPWVVRFLYGSEFYPSVHVISALSVGIVTNGLFQILGIHLAARKRLRTLTLITAVGFGVNIGLNLLLIPRWGVVGAGLSSTLSYSVSGFLTAWIFVSTTGRSWGELFLIPAEEFRSVALKLGQRWSAWTR